MGETDTQSDRTLLDFGGGVEDPPEGACINYDICGTRPGMKSANRICLTCLDEARTRDRQADYQKMGYNTYLNTRNA